jgi:S-formylglutathione hydrolase FrmB
MALALVNWFSPALAKMVAMNVLLPETGAGPFPVLYLLHGLSDDYTVWQRRTRIEWYVRDLPLIVVMPDGDRNFYTNNEEGPPYATFFAEELPAFVERNFPARSDRGGRCVGGLSMGGYGALRLALGYPDRYVSAHSHSGALLAWRYDPEITSLGPDEHRRIFGDSAEGSIHDLLALASAAKTRGVLPKLRIDCGTEDFLLGANRSFTKRLKEIGVPHEYAEFPGAHEWDYWDLHVREALAFHAAALAAASVAASAAASAP